MPSVPVKRWHSHGRWTVFPIATAGARAALPKAIAAAGDLPAVAAPTSQAAVQEAPTALAESPRASPG